MSNISLADIAQHAGVSKGTLYYYYKNKNDLLFDITDKYLNQQYQDFITWTGRRIQGHFPSSSDQIRASTGCGNRKAASSSVLWRCSRKWTVAGTPVGALRQFCKNSFGKNRRENRRSFLRIPGLAAIAPLRRPFYPQDHQRSSGWCRHIYHRKRKLPVPSYVWEKLIRAEGQAHLFSKIQHCLSWKKQDAVSFRILSLWFFSCTCVFWQLQTSSSALRSASRNALSSEFPVEYQLLRNFF